VDVEVAAGGGNGGEAEGCLNEVNRGTAIKRMARVGVSHPVGRHFLRKAGFAGSGVHNALDLGRVEMSAAFLAPEDRIDGAG
jgi:hypothetical protein